MNKNNIIYLLFLMLFIAGCEKDQSTYFYVTVDGYQWIGEPHKFVPTQDRLSLTVETKNNYYRSINIRINSFHGEGNYTISNPTFGDYIEYLNGTYENPNVYYSIEHSGLLKIIHYDNNYCEGNFSCVVYSTLDSVVMTNGKFLIHASSDTIINS